MCWNTTIKKPYNVLNWNTKNKKADPKHTYLSNLKVYIDVKIDYFADKNYGSIQRSMKTTYNILTWDDPKEKAEWG
jgi:hypothetical protein